MCALQIQKYLEEVASYVERIIEENRAQAEKIALLAEKINEYRNNEDSIKNAILGAQSLGNSMISRSKSEAQTITSDARHQAEIMIDNADRQVEREEKEFDRVKHEADTFKNSLFEMYKSHLESISNIPSVEEVLTEGTSEQKLVSPQEEKA